MIIVQSLSTSLVADPVTDTINVSVSLQPQSIALDFAALETPIALTNCSVHTRLEVVTTITVNSL